MGLFGSRDITGIDIGAGSIKFARIKGGRRPKLIAAGIVEISADPAKVSSPSIDLAYLKSGKKFGKNVAMLIPGKHLTIRFIVLPKMPKDELREAVRWEAKRHISYPLDAAQIEFLVTGERVEGATEKYEVLMVAVERGTVIEHLAPFRETGIVVSAVDANPLALRNGIRLRGSGNGSNLLVLDIGAGKTEINIYKGGALRFSRCLDTGGIDITRTVADQLGVEMEEAERAKLRVDLGAADSDPVVSTVKTRLDGLLLEIRRSVDYYKSMFREPGVASGVLTGGMALMGGIKEYFSDSLGVGVELDDPFGTLDCKPDVLKEVGQLGPRFSAAVGLALRKA